MKLTSKDKLILTFIKEQIMTKNESPTLEEIRKHFGYRSLNSIQRSVKTLQAAGYIKREKYQPRSISLEQKSAQTVNVPLVGSAPCGNPFLAVENIEGYIPTDKSLIKGDAKEYFYLRAVGDSMDRHGITDGDLVLFRSQPVAENGQVVVALLDDSATIKIFKKRGRFVVLEPDSNNPSHKPIVLTEDFSIQGVKIGVIPTWAETP